MDRPQWSELPEAERKENVFKESVYKPSLNSGDIIWVKEQWTKTEEGFVYRADHEQNNNLMWKTNLFMPKVACRIFLKITNVNTEVIYKSRKSTWLFVYDVERVDKPKEFLNV